MRIGIGIFAKTIGKSKVKTRLAESIGVDKAEEFYRLSLAAVKEVVDECIGISAKESVDDIRLYWAKPDDVCDISTRGLDLGAAMYKVASQILTECDAYILLGSDLPQIDEVILESAIQKIKSVDDKIVFGPSFDGGFYLMAGTIVPSISIMQGTPYSQDNTLTSLIKELDKIGVGYELLVIMSDVDVVEDLQILSCYLKNMVKLHETQKDILKWLKDLA